MRSLIENLERKKVLLILDWCKSNFGRSRYFRKFPKLRVYRSAGTSSFEAGEGGLCGVYDSGTIIIYLGSHKSVRELCKTVIHEYKHYLLSIREYRSFLAKLENKGLDTDDIANKHPHEKKCRAFEDQWGDQCFSQLRKKLYSKS
jgi:hypothetical protein